MFNSVEQTDGKVKEHKIGKHRERGKKDRKKERKKEYFVYSMAKLALS